MWNPQTGKYRDVEPQAKAIRVVEIPVGGRRLTAADERWLMADTGATHELQPILRGTRPQVQHHEVELQVATRKEMAYMGIDDIVYFECDDVAAATPLFPIGAYVKELKLIFQWEANECRVIIPDNNDFGCNRKHIHLHIDGTSIYIREADAAILREIRSKKRFEMRVALIQRMQACAVTMLQLEEHRRQGHPHYMPECPECRLAMGRLRSHYRLDPDTRPGGELSVDLSGPHPPTLYPSARPEDRTKRPQYFMLSAYQVMTSAELKEYMEARRTAKELTGVVEEADEVKAQEELIVITEDLERPHVDKCGISSPC